MKIAELLAILSLSAVLNVAYATEMESADNDNVAYCNEQAEMAGIDDAQEKKQYVEECVESFTAESGETQ